MEISGFWLVFVVGCLGGIMAEALNWYARRSSANIPKYMKGLRYWLKTLVVIVIGGALATLHGIVDKNALLVAQIGLSAPLMIKALAQLPPETGVKQLDSPPSILGFLAGR